MTMISVTKTDKDKVFFRVDTKIVHLSVGEALDVADHLLRVVIDIRNDKKKGKQ